MFSTLSNTAFYPIRKCSALSTQCSTLSNNFLPIRHCVLRYQTQCYTLSSTVFYATRHRVLPYQTSFSTLSDILSYPIIYRVIPYQKLFCPIRHHVLPYPKLCSTLSYIVFCPIRHYVLPYQTLCCTLSETVFSHIRHCILPYQTLVLSHQTMFYLSDTCSILSNNVLPYRTLFYPMRHCSTPPDTEFPSLWPHLGPSLLVTRLVLVLEVHDERRAARQHPRQPAAVRHRRPHRVPQARGPLVHSAANHSDWHLLVNAQQTAKIMSGKAKRY